jgi:hypothetical protein
MSFEPKAGTPAERLVGKSFTLQELRVLFTKAEFQSAVERMKNLDDAEGVVEMGSRIIRLMVEEGSWNRMGS